MIKIDNKEGVVFVSKMLYNGSNLLVVFLVVLLDVNKMGLF